MVSPGGGPAAAVVLRGTPHPAVPRTLLFSFLALAGFVFVGSLLGWLGGRLFANFSNYRCSFMTERTKGPAVSMRRPPTRGPQDPWTPRTVSLRGHPCRLLPHRPTVDGPAHEVGLHNPYAGGCAAPHRRRGAALGASPHSLRRRHLAHRGKPRTLPCRPRCQNWLAGFPGPLTT